MGESALYAEMEKLKRSHRFIRRLCLGLLLTVSLAMFVGARQIVQPVVETQALILTDQEGRVRCMLAASKTETGLVMTDHLGTKRIKLLISNGDPEIQLLNNREQPQLVLRGSESGSSVELISKNQQPQVVLKGSNSTPQLQMFGTDGKPRLSLFSLQKDYRDLAAGLSVLNKDGTVRILLTDLPEMGGNLRISNQEGKVILTTPPP